MKFLVSSTKLLDLRLSGICFWTEEGNISVKFPLIYKAETSAGSVVPGRLRLQSAGGEPVVNKLSLSLPQ